MAKYVKLNSKNYYDITFNSIRLNNSKIKKNNDKISIFIHHFIIKIKTDFHKIIKALNI